MHVDSVSKLEGREMENTGIGELVKFYGYISITTV
jgi:hypothetical protein